MSEKRLQLADTNCAEPQARLIAFYLPQFHPIPENDAWWGKGFTEWTNVAKAKPLFRGHYQPHIPADLGFYDLRLPEVRQAQAEMAREYGIHGFCYYHYWFHGKQLLERPFREVLESGQPDFPFCLCWANESWTRTWDGKESNVLVQQTYSEQDDLSHIQALLPALLDPRYIRLGGKPLLLVYRATQLPNPRRTAQIWREEAVRAGLEGLCLCRVESLLDERADPSTLGFDAAVEFQPDWAVLDKHLRKGFFWRVLTKLGVSSAAFQPYYVCDYQDLVTLSLQKPVPSYKRFPCVTPMWDNSTRRKSRALILTNSSPLLYEKWLALVLQRVMQDDSKHKYVFINAWNEWGEGNHLEPDLRHKRSYLESTLRALNISAGDPRSPER